jgi:phage gp36-like protein
MNYPLFITTADLEDRLGAPMVRRLLDDDADGDADVGPLAALCADATSKVAGYLQGAYNIAAVAANPPREVVRLTLDVAVAMGAQRHPEVMRGHDWVELMKAADRDLTALRKNAVSLDVDGAPNPQANEGGKLFPNPSTEYVYTFGRDGFGDF